MPVNESFFTYLKGNKQIPKITQNYLKNIISLATTYFRNQIVGIGLFGSYARKEADSFSDVDVIVIINSLISKKVEKKLLRTLLLIEDKYNRNSGKITITNSFYKSLLSLTGMFRSVFIVKEEDWKKKRFKKIFNVSFGSLLIAPTKLVLLSMLVDFIWIFHQNEVKFFKKNEYSEKIHDFSYLLADTNIKYQWFKSYFISQLLSVGALVFTVIS
ncbi:MAG: nucleotidyltransferase domain-containing protein, partial [Candidatus Thorarchaeota archaeon]